MSEDKTFNIRQAAHYLDISEMQMGQMVRKHRVPGEKIDGKWVVTQAALDEYKATKGRRGGNGSGKTYKLKLTDAQLADLRAKGFDPLPAFNNNKKKAAKATAVAVEVEEDDDDEWIEDDEDEDDEDES